MKCWIVFVGFVGLGVVFWLLIVCVCLLVVMYWYELCS